MTRNGNFIPNVSLSLAGQVMKAVVTLVPIIYNTDDWISWSVSLFICPFWTKNEEGHTLTIPDLKRLASNAIKYG